MRRYNGEQDIERLLDQIHIENSRIQKVLIDIDLPLRDVKQLLQQIKENIDKHKTVRNLFLGQLRDSNGQALQNVAPTTPSIVPTVPPPSSIPVPNVLAPLTPEQRMLIRTIVAQSRRLQTLEAQLDSLIDATRTSIFDFLEGDVNETELLVSLFVVAGELRRLREEIQEVRGNLVGNIVELALSLGL